MLCLADVPMDPMPMQRTEICNGVHLNHIATSVFKASTLVIDFILPVSSEYAAHYALIPQVLECGCREYPERGLFFRALEELYASSVAYRVFKRGDNQVVEFVIDFLENSFSYDGTDIFASVTDLYTCMLRHPIGLEEMGSFDEGSVELEKKNLIDSIRSLKNNRAKYALNRCVQEMFKGEPFALSAHGTEEAVLKITAKSLAESYARLLSSATVEMFYVGSEPCERLCDFARALFADIPRSPVSPVSRMLHTPSEVSKTVQESSPTSQGKLIMGFALGVGSGEEAYYPSGLFFELLSSSPTSKLFMHVRERLGLCYYCSASPVSAKGVFFVSSGIENANVQMAQEAILGEIEALAEGNISEEEWSNASKSLASAYRSLYDSPLAMCGWYLTRILGGDTVSPKEHSRKAMAVTRKEVSAFAKRALLDTVFFLSGNGEEEEVADA